MNAVVIIPWRDRGVDPLRSANLSRVQEQWDYYGVPVIVVDDGRTGDAPFNRSAAYNRGVDQADGADTFVFAESDMLISLPQIEAAIDRAMRRPGLVMPFTEYHALTAGESERVRSHTAAAEQFASARSLNLRTAAEHGGGINVISRSTYHHVGRYDENFEGAWYDDDAMKLAFEVCCGATRFIDGPAHHLFHLPSTRGAHLPAGDQAVTARNKARHAQYRKARTRVEIRALTMEGWWKGCG